jgi:hypothetical protein
VAAPDSGHRNAAANRSPEQPYRRSAVDRITDDELGIRALYLQQHMTMRMGMPHQRQVHIEKRNPPESSMRYSTSKQFPISASRAVTLPLYDDCLSLPSTRDDPRKGGFRIILQRLAEINLLDGLDVDTRELHRTLSIINRS